MTKPLIGELDLSHLGLSSDPEGADILSASGPQPAAPEKDPRTQETWTFHFSYTAPRGDVFKGTFTNRILTVFEQTRLAAIVARLQDGQPVEAIDPSIRILNAAIAHMTISLTERPEWAKNLGGLRDLPLIFELWEKVQGHEDYFFRGGPQAPQQDTSV